MVLPSSNNAKGKAKAVDGLSGDIIGHDVPTSSAAASTKAAPPRRRSIGLKAKKAAITLVSFRSIVRRGSQWLISRFMQTPLAVERLKDLMTDPADPKLIRISVKNKGCAGMSYHLEYVPPPGGKFDEVVEQDGVRVLIDSKALFSIIGSEMDWKEDRLR